MRGSGGADGLFFFGDVVHLFAREICRKRPSSWFGSGVSGHSHGNMRNFGCLLFLALVEEALLFQFVKGEAFTSTLTRSWVGNLPDPRAGEYADP